MTTQPGEIAITVQIYIKAPGTKVWESWTRPEHIMCWNYASDDWFTPRAENDLRVGGKFTSRMEARDGSMGFDFTGEYTQISQFERIESVLGDGRKVQLRFEPDEDGTLLTEVFDAEQENTIELQETGWLAILDNFKKYTESL